MIIVILQEKSKKKMIIVHWIYKIDIQLILKILLMQPPLIPFLERKILYHRQE
jgi:hypothetical protein